VSKSKIKNKKAGVPAKAAVQRKPAAKAAPKPKAKVGKKPAPQAARVVKAAKVPAEKPTSKAPAKKPAPPVKKAAVAKKPTVSAKKPAPAPVKAAKAAPAKSAPPSKKAPIPAKKAPPAAKAAPAPAARVVIVPPPPPEPPPPPKPAPKAAPPSPKTVLSMTAGEAIAPPKPPVVSTEKPQAAKSGARYYDSHMHTPLCKHAWGEPEEYCAQAVKAGLKGIIFTCHCPMPDGFWPSVRMAESEFDLYISLVQRARDAYSGKLDVCLGIESEYFPGYEKYIEGLHQRADFDYCLGGLHWQAKEYLNKYEQGTIEGFRRTYFEHLAASAETGLYDCIAHPDLVKNYHPDSWCFAIIKNTVATVLDRIAKTGVAMELNTSGLNKSYSEMNPGNEMLRMMAERKIPVVIGSDAHKAHRVGEHFVTALNNLAEAGYEEVSHFKKRQRIDLKISDVISSIKKAADANA
jgi:histidinol-phosphatase (PHP family)